MAVVGTVSSNDSALALDADGTLNYSLLGNATFDMTQPDMFVRNPEGEFARLQ